MPPKNNKSENVKQSKVKPVKKVDEESDSGETKPSDIVVNKPPAKNTKGKAKKQEVKDAKEDVVNDVNVAASAADAADVTDAQDEDSNEEESDNDEKKPKEKKLKESFEELTKKLETLQSSIKEVEKEIKELEKQTEVKEKLRRDYERQVNQISKVLLKTHNDEVTKALKSKPKRKGNVNGGFNKEHPVPETL